MSKVNKIYKYMTSKVYEYVGDDVREVLEELGARYSESDDWFIVSGGSLKGAVRLAEEIKSALGKKGVSVPVAVRRRAIYIPKRIRILAELKPHKSRMGFYRGDILVCVSDNLYPLKDELKREGYSWEGRLLGWCKSVPPDKFKEEYPKIKKEVEEILTKHGYGLMEAEIEPDVLDAMLEEAKRHREENREGLEKIVERLGDAGSEIWNLVERGDLKVVYDPSIRIAEVYPTRYLGRDTWSRINRLLRRLKCSWQSSLGGRGYWICRGI